MIVSTLFFSDSQPKAYFSPKAYFLLEFYEFQEDFILTLSQFTFSLSVGIRMTDLFNVDFKGSWHGGDRDSACVQSHYGWKLTGT